MSKVTSPEAQELQRLRRRNLSLAVVLILLLFIGAGLLSKYFEPQLRSFTELVADVMGFGGMGALLFVSDWLVSPVPPDLMLLVVANSPMRANWPYYVSILAIISMLAGHAGWICGRYLASHPGVPNWLRSLPLKQKQTVEKYGSWAVILGAATPLPFSITCWSAGFLNMKWSTFALAALFRLPRVYLFYLAIHYSYLLF